MANPWRVPSRTCKQQGERKLIRKACSSPARRLQKAGNARRPRRPCNQKLLHARSSVRRHTQGDCHCWGTDGSGRLCCGTVRQPGQLTHCMFQIAIDFYKTSDPSSLLPLPPDLQKWLPVFSGFNGWGPFFFFSFFFLALGASSCHFQISCIRQVLSTWTGRSLNL